MKSLFEAMGRDNCPPIVRKGLERLIDNLSKPPFPIMTQEEFDQLPQYKKVILTCNVIGCGKMICTHHMFCVEHRKEMDQLDQGGES